MNRISGSSILKGVAAYFAVDLVVTFFKINDPMIKYGAIGLVIFLMYYWEFHKNIKGD